MEGNPEHLKAINKILWEEKFIQQHQVKGKGYCNISKSVRFNSYIFKGSGSKNLLKQFLEHNDSYKVAAQIQDINGFRQFIPFKSWEDAWKTYQHSGYYKRYLYELILSNKPCKPYLDIEWESPTPTSHLDDHTLFLDKLIKDIIQIFDTRYNLSIKKDHVFISQCHREPKISFI